MPRRSRSRSRCSSSGWSRSCSSSAATETGSPSRPTSRARACTGSRTSAASPATTSRPATSPRRGVCSTSTASSCSRPRPPSRRADTSRAARSTRRHASSSVPSRTPGAPPYDYRVDRALKKVRAGARFLQLQVASSRRTSTVSCAEAVDRGLAAKAALIPSICLVRSPKALRFIDEKVPGISVPAALIERCENAADPEQRVLRGRVRARRARPRAPRRCRSAPDQLPPRARRSSSSAHVSPYPPALKGSLMDTVLQSRSKTVIIGPGRPFVVIGERINPTGRKVFQAELQKGDLSRIEVDVAQQLARRGHARRQRRRPAGG